jgi:hypothetical protein
MVEPSEQAVLTGVTTGGTVMPPRGWFHLASTSTEGPIVVTLNPPITGQRVSIVCRTVASTSSNFHVTATSSGYVFGSTGPDMITMSTGDAITLVGYTSSRYLIENWYSESALLALTTST